MTITEPRARHVAVVGPGAIGTTIAAALAEHGRAPALYGRSPRERLELEAEGTRIVVPGPVRTDPRDVERPADILFLAVKATQTAAAAPWLAALCGPQTVVCVLQNGIEQRATVTPLAGDARVVPSVVWFPAEAQPDGAVRLRRPARLTLPEEPAAHAVAAVLAGTRVAVDLADDFTSAAWRKLLQNAAAGLMALTGRPARIYARDDLAEVALAYLRECLDVGRADGAVLADSVPAEILAAFRAQPPDSGTSILTDREAGRPLEWDARNGVIRRVGRAHGIPTPLSDVLVPLLASTSDEGADPPTPR